jgi:hypothetical protein
VPDENISHPYTPPFPGALYYLSYQRLFLPFCFPLGFTEYIHTRFVFRPLKPPCCDHAMVFDEG